LICVYLGLHIADRRGEGMPVCEPGIEIPPLERGPSFHRMRRVQPRRNTEVELIRLTPQDTRQRENRTLQVLSEKPGGAAEQ